MEKLRYHWTNDSRFENIKENLVSVAKYVRDGIWENSKFDESKAKNGMLPFYRFYFGLSKESVNTRLILDGYQDLVLAEIIKKFQYPNPKKDKSNSYKAELDNGQQLAPQRIIAKLLVHISLNTEDDAILSLEQIEKGILANEKIVYKDEDVDISDLYNDIKKIDDTTSNVFRSDKVNVVGGDKKRFAKQMCGLMGALDCFIYEDSCIKLVNLEKMSPNAAKALLSIITYNKYWENHMDNPLESYERYIQVDELPTLESKEVKIENKESRKISGSIKGKNIIFYGAPGTGKSHDLVEYINDESKDYITEKYTNKTLKKATNVFRVTLHPEYEYSDFVGQLLPTKEAKFEYKKGVFVSALLYAYSHSQEPVFMILEEMSRANVAAVFGDLFQLLDRNESGESEYAVNNAMISEILKNEGEERDLITLPSNLYIIGTVNTSDQNVFVMDTAFKRRFSWRYKSTKVSDMENFNRINNAKIELYKGAKIRWYDLYTTLNNFITDELDMNEDKQIGPYFVKFSDLNDSREAHNSLRDNLLQYLWEDVNEVARNSYTSDKTIFDKSIKNFSNLYTSFEENKNIFSNELIDKLTEKFIDEIGME